MSNLRRLTDLLPIAAMCIALLATSAAADSRPSPVPAPDGRYGKLQGRELIGFKVQNRRVTDFFFNMDMQCHNSDTGEDYVRDFTSTNIDGGRANSAGNWRQSYTDTDGGRTGHGVVEVNFRRGRPALGSVSVIVPGGGDNFETCHGFLALPMRRGPLS